MQKTRILIVDDKARFRLKMWSMTPVMILLSVWLVAFGAKVIKNGQRRLVDRNERRDHSIFRIGRNIIERLLSNEQPLSISLVFYSSLKTVGWREQLLNNIFLVKWDDLIWNQKDYSMKSGVW